MQALFPLFLLLALASPLAASPEDYQEVQARIRTWQRNYPKLVTARSIGKSLDGRELTVVRISACNSRVSP